MMMSGSQRMLTTLATALKTTTTSGATTSDNGTGTGATHEATKPMTTTSINTATTMPASMVAATALTAIGSIAGLGGVAGASAMTVGAAVPTSREVLCGGGGVSAVACGEINGNPTTPTASAAAAAAAATSFYTNVIGNCNGHKNNGNAGNDNKCYNSVDMKASNASSVGQRLEAQQQLQQQQLQLQQQQQQMALHVPVTGPGPGRPPSTCSPNAVHPSLYGSDRQALGDFNMNVVGNNESIGGVGIVNNDACPMAAMYTANINNNSCIDHNGNSNLTNCLNGNNDNTNNTNNNNSSMFLAMQRHAADNCATLQHKQQQQHLQLHFGTHLHGQFAHDDHSPCATPPMPPSTLHNGNKCDALSTAAVAAVLGLPVALPLSLSLHLPSLSSSASAACRTALTSDPAAAGGTQCAYCCQPICDRYIMRVVDTSFHEGCLKCATCALHLVHSCYARDGKLYCRIDYER